MLLNCYSGCIVLRLLCVGVRVRFGWGGIRAAGTLPEPVVTVLCTGHIFCTATSLQCGQAWPRWREVAAQYRRL